MGIGRSQNPQQFTQHIYRNQNKSIVTVRDLGLRLRVVAVLESNPCENVVTHNHHVINCNHKPLVVEGPQDDSLPIVLEVLVYKT